MSNETPTTSATIIVTSTATVVSALPITVQAASHNSPAFVNMSVGELLQKQRRITLVTMVRKSLKISKFSISYVLEFNYICIIDFGNSNENLACTKNYTINNWSGKSIPNKADITPASYR